MGDPRADWDRDAPLLPRDALCWCGNLSSGKLVSGEFVRDVEQNTACMA
jgi:hypothetical protein